MLEIVSALCIDVIACFGKTHVCTVVQEYFVLLYLCTAVVLKWRTVDVWSVPVICFFPHSNIIL